MKKVKVVIPVIAIMILSGAIHVFASGYTQSTLGSGICYGKIELNNLGGSAYASTKIETSKGFGSTQLTVHDQVNGIYTTSESEIERETMRSYTAWNAGDIVGAKSTHRIYNEYMIELISGPLNVG